MLMFAWLTLLGMSTWIYMRKGPSLNHPIRSRLPIIGFCCLMVGDKIGHPAIANLTGSSGLVVLLTSSLPYLLANSGPLIRTRSLKAKQVHKNSDLDDGPFSTSLIDPDGPQE